VSAETLGGEGLPRAGARVHDGGLDDASEMSASPLSILRLVTHMCPSLRSFLTPERELAWAISADSWGSSQTARERRAGE
jgi:hypothetical protein